MKITDAMRARRARRARRTHWKLFQDSMKQVESRISRIGVYTRVKKLEENLNAMPEEEEKVDIWG